jgi:hypothetical protein
MKLYGLGFAGVAIRPPFDSYDTDDPVPLWKRRSQVEAIIRKGQQSRAWKVEKWHVIEYEVRW